VIADLGYKGFQSFRVFKAMFIRPAAKYRNYCAAIPIRPPAKCFHGKFKSRIHLANSISFGTLKCKGLGSGVGASIRLCQSSL